MTTKGTSCYSLKDFFAVPTITREPHEIARIRMMLGKSQEEFGDLLKVGKTTIRNWEATSGDNMREPDGPALILLYWLAEMANQSPSAKNNQIRMGSRYEYLQERRKESENR